MRFYVAILCAMPAVLAAQQVDDRQGAIPPPEPRYEVRVERSVMVPMRDGVRLSTDIYFPVEAGDPLPVILIRTPYNKKRFYDRQWFGPYMFAGQGYIVAVQDTRGKWESEGEFVMSAAETRDGYDAVDWLAQQPWSTGEIGTYGCSYLGEVQYQQARLQHPALRAIIPQAAGPTEYRYFALVDGGAMELATAVGWYRTYGSKVYYRPPAGTTREEFLRMVDYFNPGPVLPDVDLATLLWSLPTIDIMTKAGGPPSDYEDIMSHPLGDPYWDGLGYIKNSDRFDVPALHVNSWYDFGVGETLELFNQMRTNAESARGRDNQFAVISPTTHCGSEATTGRTMVGERDVGDARFHYWNLYVRWFDHWLKGVDNGVTDRSKLEIYVMGKNVWREEQEWPLARTQFTNYYLHSDGRANSLFGTGTLSLEKPDDEQSDQYVYDPAAPVPTVGGTICAGCAGGGTIEGAVDQTDVETRQDVLVYTTPPLEEGVEVTGPIQLVLYVSSSARDTDFTGKLVDVYPDGTAFNVQEGILRARYREDYEKTVFMESGEVYELRIDLHATSNFFGPGHRIRLEVSSSNFPRFDRNLNTGGKNYDETEWVVAENRVHHSSGYASHLILPVILPVDAR